METVIEHVEEIVVEECVVDNGMLVESRALFRTVVALGIVNGYLWFVIPWMLKGIWG